ncbi:MAG: alpha/beta hydrolase [Planctomycetes bacterium]|nr:alpha/beta hydrolase [Planctomycetota bacterium]
MKRFARRTVTDDWSERAILIVILKIFITLLIAYIAICTCAFLFQRRLIFIPTVGEVPDPRSMGIDAEKISIPVSQDVSLCAWWTRNSNSPYTLIWCHGNAGNMAHCASEFDAFIRSGLDMILFDYRGYGESTGSPSAEGVIADGLAVYDFLVSQGIKGERIVPYGRSIGSGPATVMANQRETAGLILAQPMTSLLEMGKKSYPFLPIGILLRENLDNESELRRYNGPLLILHGDRDEIVPYTMGERLLEVAGSEKKSLVTLKGGDHNRIGDTHGNQIVDTVKEWLSRLDR